MPIVGRDWQGRSLSDSQHSYRSDVVYMRNKCAQWRRLIAGQESTAVDGGINDIGKHTGCIVSFKGNIRIVSVALRALTLAHCVG